MGFIKTLCAPLLFNGTADSVEDFRGHLFSSRHGDILVGMARIHADGPRARTPQTSRPWPTREYAILSSLQKLLKITTKCRYV